jgi:hypothetical protein
MLPSMFVMLYIIFLIFINFRNYYLQKEKQLVEKIDQYCKNSISSINNSEFMMRKSFENYDSAVLMNHHILI